MALTRSVRPERVPGGRRRVTGPPLSVGTLMSAPKLASGKVTGVVRVMSLPWRPKMGWGAVHAPT